jgi:putative peptide zinc metalloprotease protein
VGDVASVAGALIPPLRQDLSLLPDDDPTHVVIYDPLAGRYFRIHRSDAELLRFIDLGDPQRIVAAANQQLPQSITLEHINDLVRFLTNNHLLLADSAMQQRIIKNKPPRNLGWWLGHLLFQRFPLWQPDRFLQRTLPWIAWLGSRWFNRLLLLAGLLGALLTLRQVDLFFETFLHLFNPQGALAFIIALTLVKILHELGHAWVARYHGAHVRTIGVALIVGWPILYTDTTDAWRIADRRKRLQIAMAGLRVEIAIALMALLAWNFTSDGILRSLLFLFATSTWLVSLLININPLMRFDGYYLLSDLTATPNLEPRSQMMARGWLRRHLLGITPPSAEPELGWMVGFAIATWIYRLFLYLGIALLVHLFLFKSAGLLIGALVLVHYLFRPVYNEMREWYKLRDSLRLNPRLMVTFSLPLLLMVWLVWPQTTTLKLPAQLSGDHSQLYATTSGQITHWPQEGRSYEEGSLLVTVVDVSQQHAIDLAEARLAEYRQQLAVSGLDSRMRHLRPTYISAMLAEEKSLVQLRQVAARQRVTAPFTGVIIDSDRHLKVGDWVEEGQPLIRIHDPSSATVVSYLREEDLAAFGEPQSAIFLADQPELAPIRVKQAELSTTAAHHIGELLLTARAKGAIATRTTSEGSEQPVTAHYRVEWQPVHLTGLPPHVVRGMVVVEGVRLAPWQRIVRRMGELWRREVFL